MKVFLILAVLAGSSVGTTKSSVQCYDDSYDTLPTSEAVPALSKPFTHDGLNYSAFSVAAPPPGSGGYIPHSRPSFAGIAMVNDVLQLGNVALNPCGFISPAQGTKSFDVSSFYFAYILSAKQDAVSTSQACTIAATGYYINGGPAPVQTFAFSPTTPDARMILPELPNSYTGLKNFALGIVLEGTVIS